MDAPRDPITITLETPHYVVRTLELTDATDDWGGWLADETTARMLNAVPSRPTAAQFRDYIAGFDRKTSHLLGIFEKATGQLIGIRAIYIRWKERDFIVNVLVGGPDARNKGARTESRTVMYRYFFETLGLETARGSVVSDNHAVIAMMRRNGWLHEHNERRAAAGGRGSVELLVFRLPRDVWRAKEIEAIRGTDA